MTSINLKKITPPFPLLRTRQVRLHLSQMRSREDVEAALKELAQSYNVEDLERRKGQWSALAAIARSDTRIADLAKDLLDHFLDRTSTLKGKALVVCMERANCVRLYEELIGLPNCTEIKIVMTANFAKDPEQWSEKGYYTTKAQREAIKKRMIDPDDPLQMVIVCDMWLTGTDIPCLHTLYIDKPMEGHNMIQAISRVNRVFRDKPPASSSTISASATSSVRPPASTHRATAKSARLPISRTQPGRCL
jgi:type I restriction enzyme R subunit